MKNLFAVVKAIRGIRKEKNALKTVWDAIFDGINEQSEEFLERFEIERLRFLELQGEEEEYWRILRKHIKILFIFFVLIFIIFKRK